MISTSLWWKCDRYDDFEMRNLPNGWESARFHIYSPRWIWDPIEKVDQSCIKDEDLWKWEWDWSLTGGYKLFYTSVGPTRPGQRFYIYHRFGEWPENFIFSNGIKCLGYYLTLEFVQSNNFSALDSYLISQGKRWQTDIHLQNLPPTDLYIEGSRISKIYNGSGNLIYDRR